MSRLVWQASEDRRFQTGIDRGVLYPVGLPAVPWNGLINVTEQGGQSSKTYYRDGIAYLTTVTPREYTAKLSAYTVPDEFLDIVGISEAADGLYIDSQIPDQFDLTYRTMYGDGEAYKIHIVYGATAVLGDVTYNTVTNEVDVSTFDFEIACTPQKVTGFRPSGHFIVDTRNLDRDIIIQLENILYGGWQSNPRVPPVSQLVEMLSYGAMVIITDNGDGTWTAEGSYKNVIDNEGLFTLNNVEYQDLGGGEYLIASTDEVITNPGDNPLIEEPLTEPI